jgi:uncharacterized protein YkwD
MVGGPPRSPARFKFALLALTFAVATAAASGPAQARGAERAPAPCAGVFLLSAPVVAIGLNDVVIDITGPINDVVHCELLRERRAARATSRAGRAHCKNAQVPGFRMLRKQAAKATRCQINRVRRARGLPRLDGDDGLKQAAKRHTGRMLKRNCFSHQCPGERDLVGRINATSYLPCRCAWTVAENIAWGRRSHSTPKSIVDAWMNSPPHRQVILTARLRDVDIGVEEGKPGDRGARAATYTADFGAKR